MRAIGINRARVLILIIPFLLLSFTAQIGRAQSTPIQIVSYRVDVAPNYNAPGNETFWKTIGWTNVTLDASVKPGGGHTSNVLVKSANDGFNIYVLFRWYDAQGPSFGSSSEEYYNAASQRYEYLTPGVTGSVDQLEYNASYYYPDRAAMLWFLNGTRDVNGPAMQLNSTGAITDGSANIWHWQSNPTDNNASDSGYAGGYTDSKGTLIFPPNNESFAEDDYTDKNGFSPIAGNVTTSSGPSLNLDPYANPFVVLAGNYFSSTNKTWTVEMVRPFTVSDASRYRVQLAVGSSYYVGFAVWNGRMGESSHIKSVSSWYSLSVSDQAPSTTTTTTTGISLTLALASGTGLLIAGLVIGILVRPERRKTAP